MTTLMNRISSRASNVDLPEASDLRERVFDTLEEAIDRIGDLGDPRSGVLDAAAGVRRHSRLSDLGVAVLVATGPAIFRALRERFTRPSPRARVIAAVPVIVTRRPVLIGGGVFAGLLAGFFLARAIRRTRAAERGDEQQLLAEHEEYAASVDPSSFDIDREVARMQDEGGEPDGAESARGGRRRRFARSGGNGGSGSN